MPTKKEMSDALNESLGLDVNWTRLTEADLKTVFNFVSSGLVDAAVSIGTHKAKGIGHQLVELGLDRLRDRLTKRSKA